jgi:hypothetical protein
VDGPSVVTLDGTVWILDRVLSGSVLYAFPFTNDRRPKSTDRADMYVEANFSGYAGALLLNPWSSPQLVHGRAVSQSAIVHWYHDGGPIDNQIYGVCIVTQDNRLILVDRDPRGPVVINSSNRDYRYQARFNDLPEFSG